jgi:hypothetical protein
VRVATNTDGTGAQRAHGRAQEAARPRARIIFGDSRQDLDRHVGSAQRAAGQVRGL